jgi:LPS sulfotransferase NodH
MPEYKTHNVLEIARNVKAFLSLSMGLTRGETPDPGALKSRLLAQNLKLAQAQRRIEQQNQRLEEFRRSASSGDGRTALSSDKPTEDGPGVINPENIVWILGSPRTGSTWLGRILGEPEGRVLWREPFFGVVLSSRNNLANKKYINSDRFLLGEPHKNVWLRSMRRLFLDVGQAKFPDISSEHYLIVKEPNGSMSAPLILEAFPESKLVFLVRDSRDVVASLLDAARKGSWYGYDRYEASVADAVLRNGESLTSEHRSDEEFVEQLAKNYVTNINAVKEAYARHPNGSKVMIRYEDLRKDPLGCVERILDALRIRTDEAQLKSSVEKYTWENIPKEKKGQGKFHRKATPGGWREDLTPGQVEIVERITASLLEEFYSD